MQIGCKEAALADRPLMRGCSKSPENGGVRVFPYKTELRKAGGIYSKQERFIDFLAASTVVDDEKRFVSGQNQNASHGTAQNIMAIFDQRVK